MTPEDFQQVTDLFPDAALLLGQDGSILAANGAAKELGYSPKSLLGRNLFDLVATPPEAFREYLRLCTRSRGPVVGAVVVRGEDGREVPCRCYGGLIRAATEDRPSTVLLRLTRRGASPTQFALLNQKLAELTEEVRQRRLAEERLQDQTYWLQVTLSSIGDAVITTDDRGHVTFLNPVAETLTGWKNEQASGRPLDEVFCIIDEERRQPVESPAERVLREGVIVGLANHTLLIRKDGVETPIDDSGAPIRNAQGEVAGVVLVFRDVTERKLAEDELLEASRRKDEFLAMLAHELRNPLAPIRTGLDLLALTGASGEVVGPMQQQIRHLVRLVDDLLDVSRIVRGRIELRRESIDLTTVVQRAVETVRSEVDARRQILSVSLSQEPIRLHADPVRLTQVVSNLLHNASKFNRDGGKIRVSTRLQDGEAVLSIQDTGVGMEPDLVPRVFDLFRQATTSIDRSQGGLGIGLTVVKSLVEMHGGVVTARSDGPGQGSEFIVRLPIAKSPKEDPLKPNEPAATEAYRILIVDDNVSAALMLARLLRILGDHAVVTAHDGNAALETAAQHRPDIILLDIGLPGMDGYEVARQLRQRPEFERTLVVAVTGYGTEEDRRKSLHAGCDDHLVKPPGIDSIRHVLAHPKLAAQLP